MSLFDEAIPEAQWLQQAPHVRRQRLADGNSLRAARIHDADAKCAFPQQRQCSRAAGRTAPEHGYVPPAAQRGGVHS